MLPGPRGVVAEAARLRLRRRHASDTLHPLVVPPRARTRVVRCAIYTRQSVVRPGVDRAVASCALQAEYCRAFIARRRAEGWREVERFDDEGESGATVDRDGLDFLLRAVERGELDQVVVHRVDRLSRNLSHFVRLLEFFRRFEVEVSFVDGPVESTGSFARLQLNMLGTFAEFELAMISERLTDARRARRERGLRSAGRLPFGYRSDPETRQLVPNPPDAAFVRRCFERAAAGVLPAELAADGVRRGGALAKWTARAVTRMLRNPVYAGRFPDGGQSPHEALVSAELFERAGAAISGRTTARTAPRRLDVEDDPFVLRGSLKCPLCRKAMIPAANVPMRKLRKATPRYYRCRTHGCDGEPLIAAEVEGQLPNFLLDLPREFPAGHRHFAAVSARVWHLFTRINQRRTLSILFSFLAWAPRTVGFVAEPSELDLSEEPSAESVSEEPLPASTLHE